MKSEEEKNKIIILQRKKIEELSKKTKALDQEIFLLNEETRRLKKLSKRPVL